MIAVLIAFGAGLLVGGVGTVIALYKFANFLVKEVLNRVGRELGLRKEGS